MRFLKICPRNFHLAHKTYKLEKKRKSFFSISFISRNRTADKTYLGTYPINRRGDNSFVRRRRRRRRCFCAPFLSRCARLSTPPPSSFRKNRNRWDAARSCFSSPPPFASHCYRSLKHDALRADEHNSQCEWRKIAARSQKWDRPCVKER